MLNLSQSTTKDFINNYYTVWRSWTSHTLIIVVNTKLHKTIAGIYIYLLLCCSYCHSGHNKSCMLVTYNKQDVKCQNNYMCKCKGDLATWIEVAGRVSWSACSLVQGSACCDLWTGSPPQPVGWPQSVCPWSAQWLLALGLHPQMPWWTRSHTQSYAMTHNLGQETQNCVIFKLLVTLNVNNYYTDMYYVD